jgi:hypothetical protein
MELFARIVFAVCEPLLAWDGYGAQTLLMEVGLPFR